MSSPDLTVTGVVSVVEGIQTFGNNGFQKRTVVLEQDQGKFINYLPFELTNDDCHKADEIKVGSTLQVRYFLNGRKWQKDESSEPRYFVSLRMADFRVLEEEQKTNQPTSVTYNNADVPF